MVTTRRRKAAAAEAETASAPSSKSAAKGGRKPPAGSKAETPETPPSTESVSLRPEVDEAEANGAKPEPRADVPTIPLFDFDLPLELEIPYGSRVSAFNPAPYEALKTKLQRWFPDLAASRDDQDEHLSQEATSDVSHDSKLDGKHAGGKAKKSPPSSKKNAKVNQSKRKGKAKAKAEKLECIHLEVEFVPQAMSDYDLQLPRSWRGWSGTVNYKPHNAFAVVALAPPDYMPDPVERKRKSPAKVEDAASDEDQPMFDDDQDDPETLLLGYIVPSALKDTAHPLAHIDASLMSKEWIQLYGEVTLTPPFLPPESEVFGPAAFEASHKRGSTASSSVAMKPEPGVDPMANLFGAPQPFGSGNRAIMSGANVPSTRLLGILSVQVGLEPAALQYGMGDEKVDGFVESNADLKNTAAEGSLGLAKALRQAIPSIVDWQHSFIELDMDAHSFWDRNESFYKLPPKQSTLARHLVLDKLDSVDLPVASPSKSPAKKRKSSSNGSRASRASRVSLLTVPSPVITDDDEYRDDGTGGCPCPECMDRQRGLAPPRPAEPPRPKLDVLPLGEQISSSDPRLGDINDPKFLPLDLNVASLLEACRPPSDGPQVFPPADVIPTPLLGYQARCLAWMIKRETVVDEDVGHLMPNWFPLRCKSAAHIMQRRLQLEAEREALLDAMQRGLSRSRRVVNVKAAQAATAVDTNGVQSSTSTIAHGSLKREPFIDPADQAFYYDQVSGLLSLRRFSCRPSEPGGALCESMGLGKTLESLSLIAAHPRPDNPDLLAYDTSRSARMIAEMEPSERPFVSRATLVVCPAALVEQWMDEIHKHFRSRSTFAMDESEDATALNQQPGVIRYRHADFAWDVRSRRSDVRALAESKLVEPDIVVATYEELAFQLAESHRVPHSDDQVRTPLLEVLFWRILLDEAQIVAGASGKATNMVHELWRSNCWMVTGTPVTKGIGDIQGIFAFMDHDPFAAPRFFREILQQPFSRGCVEGIRRLRAILPRFVWRHTQAHVEDEIVLPPCKSEVLELPLKHIERLFYDKEVGKYRQTYTKQAVRGIANVAQPTFLVHLRQLLSHPQVADEFMYSHNYSRLSFAELFRRFCQQAESELDTIRMQVVSSTLQLTWGHDFREAEKDKRHWRGGPTPLNDSEGICKLLNGALRVVTMALDEQTRAKMASSSSEGSQQSAEPNAEAQASETADPSAEVGIDTDVSGNDDANNIVDAGGPDSSASTSAPSTDAAGQQGSAPAETAARVNLTWEEANYWLRTLLAKHADPASGGSVVEQVEPPTRWDPERPTRTFYDKEFKNATDASVDLKDARYHLVVQDAGAEDMNEEEYLAQLEAEQSGKRSNSSNGPRKKAKRDAAFEPGLLKKSRLRGKASQRQIERVWLYKPKERLETTHARLLLQQAALPGKEHEVAFLREQMLELAAASGTDGGQAAGTSDAATVDAGSECQICYEPKLQIGVLPCYHSFCVNCIDTLCENKSRSSYSYSYDRPRCPSCRLAFTRNQVTRVMERGRSASADGTEAVVGDWSGKISGLIVDLKARLSQDATHKAVVFSHWPKMLTFVRDALVQNDVTAVVFGGNEAKQAEALRAIRDDDHVHVILVPFRASAGAAGLTLTSCDLAYLMEPALDAALEAQAVGRIHRIGQRRETTIIRVKMKDTIEDAVMRIADERSHRGMALAAHVEPSTQAAPAAAEPVTSSAAAAVAAGAGAATGQSATPSSSRTTVTQAQASTGTSAKSEQQGGQRAAALTTDLRERSIKSSVAASVGIGRESDNTSLTMVEVSLILGFDIEEEKRKARERRESLLQRAGYPFAGENLTERQLDFIEEELAWEEEEEDDFPLPDYPLGADLDDLDSWDEEEEAMMMMDGVDGVVEI
ncbi:related to SNF2 family helicase/ATPase [Sporisorium reilianum f. sp. reilianum]|uniref:Related to SNF2 family helicase/ATPase n=1 Tax=Sporisorium reilianum f. sp. reilianum TaxID=72559 RepID=A0A2N8U6Z0_9BASI|nr:related to SNF2 family helicase/ATPase [Sporisorium reilianum f. sp. reilianum]